MSNDIRVPKIARTIVGWIESHPLLSILIALSVLGGFGTGLPKIQADFTHRGFFYSDDPLLVDFDRFERQFGNDDAVVVAMHSPSGVFDLESAQILQKLTERMWEVPEVIRVDSLANFNWVHAEGDELIIEPLIPDDQPLTAEILGARQKIALGHETIPDYLVSKDSQTAMVFARIKPGIERPPNAPVIVAAVESALSDLKTGDHEFYISGGPAVTNAFKTASVTDFSTLIPIVVVLTILLLAVLLRSFLGILLSLVIVITSVMTSMGLAGLTGIQISNVTSVLPQILIAIGVADAIHILVTFLSRLRMGEERREAARYSLLKNFQPTIITSITTAIGFLTFSTANLKPIAGLGVLAGFGTLVAWVFTYFLVGPLLFKLPFRVKVTSTKRKAAAEARATWATSLLSRYRTPILASFGAIAAIAVVASTQNTVNSDPFKYFAEGFPIRTANDFIEEHVGGARGAEIAVNTGTDEGIKDPAFLKKVEALQSWIESDLEGVTRTLSIIDILKQTNRSLHGDDPAEYRLPTERAAVGQEIFLYTMSLPQGMSLNDRITVKNDALRITVLWTISSSKDVVHAIERIEDKAKGMGLEVVVTGKNRLYQSMNGYVVHSFIVSITTAVLMISLVLILFFRSIRIGLIAMIPNTVPLLIGGGVLWAIGKPLDIGTVLVMSVCLGIAVDDTIHVLTNFERLVAEGHDRESAVRGVLYDTSPALITTSIILVLSFGTFVFATFTPNLYLGLLTAIILSIALITDLTFLPALLMGAPRRKQPEPSTAPAT